MNRPPDLVDVGYLDPDPGEQDAYDEARQVLADRRRDALADRAEDELDELWRERMGQRL